MLKPLSLSALATAPKADAAPVLREAGLGAWLHPVFPAPAFAPLAWEPSSSPAVVPLLLELLSPITFQEDAGAELVGLVCEALSHWAASVDPLPLPLREDYVRDAAEALKSPLVQARPLHERVRFLFQVRGRGGLGIDAFGYCRRALRSPRFPTRATPPRCR
jgi:hypothetical protein